MPKRPAVCDCSAYPWPHRYGGGQCVRLIEDSVDPLYCSKCGEEVEPSMVVVTALSGHRSPCCGVTLLTEPKE